MPNPHLSPPDSPTPSHPRPKVVVIGSGFGGMNAALHLGSAPVEVTVIDRDNYHGFWPLLYQVATAGLGPDDIAYPIRSVYKAHRNITVRLGSVSAIDVEARRVEIDGEESLEYDYLVVAAGSSTNDYGIPGVAEHAFPLKTLPDAVRLRNHILLTFERADAQRIGPGALTIVLAGGGPTGVEMAGALAELIGKNLANDFQDLDVDDSRIVLVEATDHLLGGFSAKSQADALETLRVKGVEVRFKSPLAEIDADEVKLVDGTVIPTRTVVWTAGIRANPVAALLPGERGKGGGVKVQSDLSLPGHPEVFVIGDIAAAVNRRGEPLPQLAQVAIQGGRHAARSIHRRLNGRTPRPFHYHNHGIMATIGRRAAVAELPGGIQFSGTLGWLSWLVVHLLFLVGFRNRIVVFISWAWNYLTWDRSSRVILGDSHPARQTETISS